LGEILVDNRVIVCPGDLLGKGLDIIAGRNTYRVGENIYAKIKGLTNIRGKIISIIPLAGCYIPEKGHSVIGEIYEVGTANWLVEINAPWLANLPLGEAVSEYVDVLREDLSKYFDVGDIIYARVLNVPKNKMIQLSLKGPNYRKLIGGKIIKISPSKVPRVIGRKGSMINIIMQLTKCKIIIGQNGWIWVKGDPRMEILVARALEMIEKESHTKGLTERVKAFLEERI